MFATCFIDDKSMGDVCRQRLLWNSLFPICLSLNVIGSLGVINITDFVNIEFNEKEGCYFGKMGVTYLGSRNITKNGKACQSWTADGKPHQIDKNIKDDGFPDESREMAKNFCRNPQPMNKSRVWCYTTDPNVEWEYCDPCPNNFTDYSGCTLADKGISYKGTLNRTRSNALCEPWSDHPDKSHQFPDGDKKSAENFCRNPNPSVFEAPWCYVNSANSTTNDSFTTEYCEVCIPFQGEVKKTEGTGFQDYNVMRFFAMSDSNCIGFCLTYLSCQAAIISVEGPERRCLHVTDLGGIKISRDYLTQHVVSRVCTSRAKDGPAYFVNTPHIGSVLAHLFYKGTMEECDEECIDFSKCSAYVYDPTETFCYYVWYFGTDFFINSNITERLIVRCNPELKAISYQIPPVSPNSTSDADLESSSTLPPTGNQIPKEKKKPETSGSQASPTETYSSLPTVITPMETASTANLAATPEQFIESPEKPAPIIPNAQTDKIENASTSEFPGNQSTTAAPNSSNVRKVLLYGIIAIVCFGLLVALIAACVYYCVVIKPTNSKAKDSAPKDAPERKKLIA